VKNLALIAIGKRGGIGAPKFNIWSKLQYFDGIIVSRESQNKLFQTKLSMQAEIMGLPKNQTWNWVTGSMGHLGHLSRPSHRVIILIRCETRVFPVFEKMPKMQNVHLRCWNDKSHCLKTYIFVKIRPTVVEILTFNKWSSKFYFPEACKRRLPIANVCHTITGQI